MFYSNLDFNVKYIDPSAAVNGDGLTPDTAANSFGILENNTCYLIRRTPESSSVLLPTSNTANTVLVNVLLFGMPRPGDRLWSVTPPEARLAWGDDSDEYANIRAETGNGMGQSSGIITPNIRLFLLHRVYLFRDNTPGESPVFNFSNANYNSHIAIENCKFGAKGIDLERDDFTAGVTSNSLKAYIQAKYPRVFAMRDCIVNYSGNGSGMGGYTYGVYVENAHYITVQNIECHTTTNSYGMGPGGSQIFYFGSGTGAMANYDNIKFHVLQNNTNTYLPRLFYSIGHNHCRMKNLTVDIPLRRLGTGTPASRIVSDALIQCLSNREFRIEDIAINLPQCWRIEDAGRILVLSGYSGSYVPGAEHVVSNITIQLEENNGFDADYNGIRYDSVKQSDYNKYSALVMNFTEGNYSGLEFAVADNITVNHPRGQALYANGLQLQHATFKGTVRLTRCMADIDAIESFYPGYALYANEGSTVRVHELKVNKNTAATTGGINDPAVGGFDSSLIYVDKSNAPLRDNQTSAATTGNQYAVICGNESDTGHFVHRSVNCVCDTWNVNRTGGAPACYKIWNNALDTVSDMSLGRAPFKGVQLVPEVTGKHIFTLHIATKNQATPAELASRFLVQISAFEPDGTCRTYFGSCDGVWSSDDSIWNNDDDLSAYRLEIPVNLTTLEPVDVKIHFNWYSGLGYVYLDPQMTLTKEL